MRLLLMGLLMAAWGAMAAPVEAIAFYGKVDDQSGEGSKEGKMITLDFKLYTTSGSDGELLWARRIPVSLDAEGGFYVELADTTGQSYQSTDGITPYSDTLAKAFAHHASVSEGPVWIGYTPVDAKVATPPERDGIYYQPVAVHALATSFAEIARVKELTAKTAVFTGPLIADKIVSGTTIVNASNLKVYKKDATIELNPSGSVKLKSLSGFRSALPDENGVLSSALPAVADSDCGRVVSRRLANGNITHETIFYVKGEQTAAPSDSTTIYIWTFGKLEEN